MIYVIGDVHGEITKLKLLVDFIVGKDVNPEFIFIGDYIDKGEDARTTLAYLVKLKAKYACKFLIGNHEYCWKDAGSHIDYLLQYGGKNTMHSFGCTDVMETQKILLDEYGDFFNELIDYHITGEYFISHSGLPPEYYTENNLEHIPQRSFLFNRYPFITNQAFFQHKFKVIFGHTGFFTPYVDQYKIGIDTAACFLEAQPLTAFCVDTESFINSNLEQIKLAESAQNYCPNILRNKPWRIYD